ncbi:uncharacterized protein LOC132393677 [Hypanus sabinus]|uniref:uncharacterized protein LOC132393677 n=1 Tax=Hypanus sabinus TaxID=79690 RepID=UPI0028C4F0E3|nr:uncharacterized protein LOC132393677 [Hypanus sabinus]
MASAVAQFFMIQRQFYSKNIVYCSLIGVAGLVPTAELAKMLKRSAVMLEREPAEVLKGQAEAGMVEKDLGEVSKESIGISEELTWLQKVLVPAARKHQRLCSITVEIVSDISLAITRLSDSDNVRCCRPITIVWWRGSRYGSCVTLVVVRARPQALGLPAAAHQLVQNVRYTCKEMKLFK